MISGHRSPRLRAALAVALLGVVLAFAAAAEAAPNPCRPLGAPDDAVRLWRASARRLLPVATWRALERDGYYVCTATQTAAGKLGVVSFKLPIPRVGRRISFRFLIEPDAGVSALALARSIRADPAAFVRALAIPDDQSTRIAGVAVAGHFIVVTLSGVRRT
jgi:hypothetical protein